MERGNGNTVLLTVIGVATLLVALVGATFAYFSASITGNAAEVNVTTVTLSGLTVNSYPLQGSTDYYPGWKGYQVITVDGDGGSGVGNYTLKLTATNPYTTALTYTVYRADSTLSHTNGVLAEVLTEGSIATTGAAGGATGYTINGAALDATATSMTGATVLGGSSNYPKTLETADVDTADFTGSTHRTYVVFYEFLESDEPQTQGQTFTASWSAALNNLAQ